MRHVVPAGPRAWLVEVDGDEEPVAVAAAVGAARRDGVVDVVPGARTVLVTTVDHDSAVGGWLRAVEVDLARDPAGAPSVELPVVYDGDDLASVATTTGLSVDDVVAAHTAATYRCAFCGFAPGFAYLRGLDPALHLPRRATPRTRVPAGAVAIAAEYSAVYPAASPGGWHLLGRTDVSLWDIHRDPPAVIVPGATVRFVVS